MGNQRKVPIKKVVLVFKTHVDIGFTDLAANVVDSYKTNMLKAVIDTCEKTRHMGNQKYVWTVPSWLLYQMIDTDKVDKSELAKKACELVECGQLRWHALPFTSHFDFCSTEDYMRGSQYSNILSERFSIPRPITAKMTDVPGHGYFLPTALNKMGIEFFHMGSNEFPMPLDIPRIFNWEGPDGSKVLTMYSKSEYGTRLEAPNDWEYPVWMAIMQTNDNLGPQTKEVLEDIIKKAETLYPDAEIVTGTMDDFYSELKECNVGEVPTVKMDMGDTWIHGVGTYPKEVSELRDARAKLIRLEKAFSVLNAVGENFELSEIQNLINEAYDNIITFEEHTWGLDCKINIGYAYIYDKDKFNNWKKDDIGTRMESSWQEQKVKVQRAVEICNQLDDILKSRERFADDNSKITLFNPFAENFTGYVELSDDTCEFGNKLLENDSDQFAVESLGNRQCVYVEGLKPLSFTSFNIIEDEIKKSICNEDFIENHKYKIVVNKSTGRIIDIYDKVLGKSIVSNFDKEVFGGYRYDKYSDKDIDKFMRDYGNKFSYWAVLDNGKPEYPICEHEVYRPQTVSVEISENSITITSKTTYANSYYGDCESVKSIISLPSKGDEIFVDLCVDGKSETMYAESGYVTFPFNIPEGNVYINKTGTMVDISDGIVKNANHANYCIENIATIINDELSITVRAFDTPLMSVGELGMWNYKTEYEKPKSNTLYFNLFNNMWGTNFPQWISGDYTYRFSISSGETDNINDSYSKSITNREGIHVLKGKSENTKTNLEIGFDVPLHLLSMNPILDGLYLVCVKNTSDEPLNISWKVPHPFFTACYSNVYGEATGHKIKKGSNMDISMGPYGIEYILLDIKS